MIENKFKYFSVTTTSIVKAANIKQAEKVASSNGNYISGVSGEILFKDVEVERITAVEARQQTSNK